MDNGTEDNGCDDEDNSGDEDKDEDDNNDNQTGLYIVAPIVVACFGPYFSVAFLCMKIGAWGLKNEEKKSMET
jgi:hypothetical protein